MKDHGNMERDLVAKVAKKTKAEDERTNPKTGKPWSAATRTDKLSDRTGRKVSSVAKANRLDDRAYRKAAK